jgi:Cyclic nucleotide-binding domain
MTLVTASKKLIKFDPQTFLPTINGGRKIEAFAKKQTIFAQGDSSDAVSYIKEGKVKLTFVSEIGKEATIGILKESDFFGEGCLTGQPLRLCSATAMTDCSVMKIDKKSMNDVLHREHAFSDMFVAYLLARNIRETDAGPTEFTLGMDRRGDHHGGNVRRGRGHVRCLRCGSLWPHRAGHSLICQSYAVWIRRTKLPKTNEEEEGRADFLLFGYRVQRAVVPAKSRSVFLTSTEDSPVEETSSQAR